MFVHDNYAGGTDLGVFKGNSLPYRIMSSSEASDRYPLPHSPTANSIGVFVGEAVVQRAGSGILIEKILEEAKKENATEFTGMPGFMSGVARGMKSARAALESYNV